MRIDSLYLKDIGPFDEVKIDFPEGKNPDLADVYLLTGENGCGKSTVLYAIAAIIAKGKQYLGRDHLAPRLRGISSLAAVRLGSGDVEARAHGYHSGEFIDSYPDPFTPSATLGIRNQVDGNYYSSIRGPAGELEDYLLAINHFPTPRAAFNWAAFAYSGSRHVSEIDVVELREPAGLPFQYSLDFQLSADWDRFMYWIAGQYFRLLKADANKDAERARTLRAGIEAIERTVSRIVGKSFAFHMPVDENNVQAIVDDVKLKMTLIPTGLQSIVSWVADLLMRLDRIPWVDDTPVMQRAFLLLLDEIDIHLHPAWQRRILPMVASLFPKAQIIASTHSPFVVASAEEDARVIRFIVKDGRSTLDPTRRGAQVGTSVSAVLTDVFGIKTEFDIGTEEMLDKFTAAKQAILAGTSTDREGLWALGRQIASRGEELSSIIGFELRQLDRLLAESTRASG